MTTSTRLELHQSLLLKTSSPNMSITAIEPFQTLLTIIPKWISEIEAILRDCSTSHSTASAQTLDRAPSPASLSHRSQSYSSERRLVDFADFPSTPAAPVLAQTHVRKRKASSSTRSNRPTSRQQLKPIREIVYDGATQKQFECIVSSIGTCRNGLRKGKMSVTVDYLSRRAFCSDQVPTQHGNMIGQIGQSLSSTGRGMSRSPVSGYQGRLAGQGNKELTMGYDKVDKDLEQGQNLLEKAAFLMLRDGRVDEELKTVQRYLEVAEESARAEVDKLESGESLHSPPYSGSTPQVPAELDDESRSPWRTHLSPDLPLDVDSDHDDDDNDALVSKMVLTPSKSMSPGIAVVDKQKLAQQRLQSLLARTGHTLDSL